MVNKRHIVWAIVHAAACSVCVVCVVAMRLGVFHSPEKLDEHALGLFL